ncbi:Transcriptional regulator, MarR family [Georgfuchsia toluolica]|uniref:Transcriptional regulator, MarR family n=1 Tax=Georgfuchsia toluolica TaxID=424218 RepID=A0A916J6D5_9PROT|nr:MarR family transcriptional regulator [Georgfuchsia toluolica]CAG4883251.1 Transcriptional regulator, MarR family [Georgfuchsia toluolica]
MPANNLAARKRQATKTNDADGNLDYGLLTGLVGYQLRLAQIAVFRDFSETLGGVDITPGLFGVLVVIESNPGLKQTRLAQAVHLDRSSVVSIIDNLERRGLVERQSADRRSNAIFLTNQGMKFLRKVRRLVLAHEKRLIEHLTAKEHKILVALLQKIFPDRR